MGYGGGIRPRLQTGVRPNRSRSQIRIATDGQPIRKSWCRAPSALTTRYLLLIYYGLLCAAPSLTRGRVCLLYMLPALASTVLGSEYPRDRDHTYCLGFETSPFVASFDSQGHGGGIRPRLQAGEVLSRLLVTCRRGLDWWIDFTG
jgi:hypothetical protein